MINIVFIDNFDSFTYNLVDEFAKRNCEVFVYRNNTPLKQIEGIIKKFNINLIVLSPGPGTPKEAGNSIEIVKKYAGKIPIFGVCLGHEVIAEAFGGNIISAEKIIHGKASYIKHDNNGIFQAIENPFLAGRYHSLIATLPKNFVMSAKLEENNEIMAMRHEKYFIESVQFHPESVLTACGGKIIENLIKMLNEKAAEVEIKK